MELERMSRITRMSCMATAKEFVDMIEDKTADCMKQLQALEQDLHTIKEATEETLLQLNNAIFEDCM